MVSRLVRAGPTNQLLNLVSKLDRSKFIPEIITLSPESGDSMIECFRDTKVRVTSFMATGLRGTLLAVRHLNRLDGSQPLIVHSQGIRADIATSFSGNEKIKKVATIRNYPIVDYVFTYGRAKGRVMAHLHISRMKLLDRVVSVSADVNHKLKQHGLKTSIIRNGVSVERYEPADDRTRKSLRDRYGVPEDALIVVCVGHLSSRKDPVTLLRGLDIFSASRPVHVLLVGDGDLAAPCRAFASATGNLTVDVVGRVDNPLPYLQMAEVFASSSLGEGMPNAVLEAIACGLPIVLSDIGPHRELAELCRPHSEVFACGNPEDCARAFGSLVSRSIGPIRAVRNLAETSLSATATTHAYQALYEDLISER